MHHKEFYEIMKTLFTVCKYLHFPEIFSFEKCVKYANEMTDEVIHSTQYYIKYINGAILASLQAIETWQAYSSTENTLTAIKHFVPMATHSFPVPTHLISIC